MSSTPEHYRTGGVTPWEYCAAKFPESYDDHLLITAIEYISRAKHKAGASDIRKAYNNLGHWLKRNEPETQPDPAADGKRYRVEYWSPDKRRRVVSNIDGRRSTGLTWDEAYDYVEWAQKENFASPVRGSYRIVEDTPETLPEPQPDPVYRVQYQYPGSERWEHYGTFSDLAKAKATAKAEADHSPNRKWRVLVGRCVSAAPTMPQLSMEDR